MNRLTKSPDDFENLTMFDIEPLKPAISRLCSRLQVKRLDIFGSAATDRFGPNSDVDVLVVFEQNGDGLFNRYFDLKEGLERILDRNVDLITARSVKNPYFKQQIEQTRKNVYVA